MWIVVFQFLKRTTLFQNHKLWVENKCSWSDLYLQALCHLLSLVCNVQQHIDGQYNIYENEGAKYMRGFSGGAEDWKMSCIVHHFTGISDFQDIGSNITAVIVFNVPVVEFQY